jgi:UDP-N-acetylglucosamine--N-acetylmuramyl-(pentapeptide) pyrophosphoryl-undecaprenol N-acetylglucosamine transferase
VPTTDGQRPTPPLRVIIAGGGTGGHVIPALAIARELSASFQAEVEFIGTPRGIENRLVPQSGFPLRLVEIGALKNVSFSTRLRTFTGLPRAVLAARRMIRDFRPHVVVGVGGYASGPAMIAAILARAPTVAFEPNLVPGFANRAIARWVDAAAVHFEETARYFRNAQVTGVPVRKEFFALAATSPEVRTLLITGGSQGARAINQAVVGALPELARRVPGLRIIHQTGERDHAEVKSSYAKAGIAAEVSPFIDDMPSAFARAALIVCRSGASTVAEITAAGKVAIFIPFPQAADDHQRRNAEALSSRGAAVLLPQSELTPERLTDAVAGLFQDQGRLQAMSVVSKSLAHPDAAPRIAEMVRGIANPD